MALARRLAVALAALVGLVLAVLGIWFAIVLGPHGTASFSATSEQPAVLIGPNILNRVAVPATVTAHAASGPVFLGASVPQDASDIVGTGRHTFTVSAAFPARTLQLETLGSQPLADPTASHVWRSSGQETITVEQNQAPEAVLAYATKGGPVDVTVSFSRGTWFLESLVLLVVGLILLAFAGGWLWQHARPAVFAGSHQTSEPQPVTDAEPAPERDAEPTPESDSEPAPEPDVETEPGSHSEPAPVPDAEPAPEPDAEHAPDHDLDTNLDTDRPGEVR
ncbi:MAG: hypothetical protein M3Y26_01240 [Actinomycetota bacterium]|nr:hypothetical protein [Actinomycetota bacterium]